MSDNAETREALIVDGALSNLIDHCRENYDHIDPQYGQDARRIRDALRRGDLVLAALPPVAGPEGPQAIRLAADNMPLRREGQPWQGASDWLHRRADGLDLEWARRQAQRSVAGPEVRPDETLRTKDAVESIHAMAAQYAAECAAEGEPFIAGDFGRIARALRRLLDGGTL